MNEQTYTEIRAKRGSQYFGSGGYSAGWHVIEGRVEATPITGSEFDNGFISGKEYLLRPKTDVAVIRLHCSDAISNSGHRALGREGLITLVSGVDAPPPAMICEYTVNGKAILDHALITGNWKLAAATFPGVPTELWPRIVSHEITAYVNDDNRLVIEQPSS